MSTVCERALQVDIAGFLADPTSSRWLDFRDHAEGCGICFAEVSAWNDLRHALSDDGNHLEEELLLAFADNRNSLPEVELELAETHLADCPSCRDELSVLESIHIEPAPMPEPVRAASGVFAAIRLVVWNPVFAYAVVLMMLVPTVRRWAPSGENNYDVAVQSEKMTHANLESARTREEDTDEAESPRDMTQHLEAMQHSRAIDPQAMQQLKDALASRATSKPLATAPDAVDQAHTGGSPRGMAVIDNGVDLLDSNESRTLAEQVSPGVESSVIVDSPLAKDDASARQGMYKLRDFHKRTSPEAGALVVPESRRGVALGRIRILSPSDAAESAPSDGETRVDFVPGTQRRVTVAEGSEGIAIRFGVRRQEDADTMEARARQVVPADTKIPTPNVVTVPANTHQVQLRMTKIDSDRDLHFTHGHITLEPGTPVFLEVKVPVTWLSPGRYRVAVHAGRRNIQITEPLTLEISD